MQLSVRNDIRHFVNFKITDFCNFSCIILKDYYVLTSTLKLAKLQRC